MINCIKVKIDNTQQGSKWRLHGNKDETINQMINENSKITEKYKSTHDWVIPWEFCKKLKFNPATK